MSDFTKLLLEIDQQGVAQLSINNPEKHNAFDDHIIAELTTALLELEQNSDVRCAVLGSVGKSFSAGGDLNWMKRMADYSFEENLKDAQALARLLQVLNELSKPTIARVQGVAYGGAVGLVSCCDIAVGTERARFCLSEVKVGLIPATISPYVIAAIGQRAARRYFLTAEVFNAETANQLGLLSEVVEEENLDTCIADLINALLSNSPAAITEAKKLVADVSNQSISQELIDDTSQRIAAIRVSEEGQQGLTAFLNKQTPSWIKPKD